MVAPADPETADVNPREGWPLTYWAKVAVVVTLVVGGLLILRRASDVFVLILTAAVLAVGLDPSVRWLERRGLGRGTAVGVIVLLGLLGLAAFLWFVIPEFVDQAKAFAGDLPQLLKRLSARDDWIRRFIGNADLQRHFQDVVENAPSDVANSFDLWSGSRAASPVWSSDSSRSASSRCTSCSPTPRLDGLSSLAYGRGNASA